MWSFKHWFLLKKEKLCWWLVGILPKQVVLYCYCFVVAANGEAPPSNNKDQFDFFVKKYGAKP